MNDPQIRYVGFGGRQVEIYSNAPEVLAGLEHRFRHMLAPEPAQLAGWLRVFRRGERYRLMGSGEAQAKTALLEPTLYHLHDAILLQLVRANAHLVWLHAGAVAHQDKALIIAGPSGGGKSTLATTLYRRGWPYLGDDLLPLDGSSGQVLPFPQTPGVRRNGGRILPAEKLHELEKIEIELDPARVAQTAMPVEAILLPAYRPGPPARLEPVGPAEAVAALLENCVNFSQLGETAVAALCRLADARPAFRLPYGDSEEAADRVVEALEGQ